MMVYKLDFWGKGTIPQGAKSRKHPMRSEKRNENNDQRSMINDE
jgi:hypothetical protein